VDRAKDFYEALGWRLDANFGGEDDLRVVQLTPPGSPCSIIFGTGLTSAMPGSADGLQLVVTDIEAARAELVERGAEVSEVFHDSGGMFHHAGTVGRAPGPAPDQKATALLPHLATRTATAGLSRRSRRGSRAGEPARR
jgi:catechol 2,3-dioxygenase-like lactoylglutathione lyase family enzyme